jgi:hypothetical protein
MAGEAGVRQQRGDQRGLSRDDPALLPQQRIDLAAVVPRFRQRVVDPLQQRLAALRMARQRGQPADLRRVLRQVGHDAERLDPDAEPREGLRGGRGEERARHHHVWRERQHFLHGAAGSAQPPGFGQRHRGGARIVAVVRDRQQLRGVRDFGEDRVGAGVEADDRGVLARRDFSGRCTPYHRHSRESGNPVAVGDESRLGPRFRGDDEVVSKWAALRALREKVTEAIEPLRREKIVRSGLEAEVTVPAALVPEGFSDTDLAQLFITGIVVRSQDGAVTVRKTADAKCGRCWRLLPEVPADGALCHRCDDAVAQLDAVA